MRQLRIVGIADDVQSMASVKAMSRFLNHEEVTLPALIEPLQEAIRDAIANSEACVALVIHDWSMFSSHTHSSKTDCYQRTHDRDVGYDLGTAPVVDADNGRPLGPYGVPSSHGEWNPVHPTWPHRHSIRPY